MAGSPPQAIGSDEERSGMSILKKLFGGGGGDAPAPPTAAQKTEHNGFSISATPYKEGGQFQTCGVISKMIGGTLREHKFIRADRFQSQDEAMEFTIRKGRQIVDEQGDRLFL
jgi:hypothetical protein